MTTGACPGLPTQTAAKNLKVTAVSSITPLSRWLCLRLFSSREPVKLSNASKHSFGWRQRPE